MSADHRGVGFACVLVLGGWSWLSAVAAAQAKDDVVTLSIAPNTTLQEYSMLAGASTGKSYRAAGSWGTARWTTQGAARLPKSEVGAWFEDLCATAGVLLDESPADAAKDGDAASAKAVPARELDLADPAATRSLRAQPATRFTTVFAVDADSRELVRGALKTFVGEPEGRVEEVKEGPGAGGLRVVAAGARIATLEGLVAALTGRASRADPQPWLEVDEVATQEATDPEALTVGSVAKCWSRQTERPVVFEGRLESKALEPVAGSAPAGADQRWSDVLAAAELVVIRSAASTPDTILVVSPATAYRSWSSPAFVPHKVLDSVSARRAEIFVTVIPADPEKGKNAGATFQEILRTDRLGRCQFVSARSCVIAQGRGHHLAELARRLAD